MSPAHRTHDIEPESRWRPLWRVLAWPNNLVTLARGISVVALMALHLWNPAALPLPAAALAFVLLYWASDHLDGWLARRLKKCSSFGESLDLLIDRLCDLVISATLLLTAPQHAVALLIFLVTRVAPDTMIARYTGLQGDMFRTAARDAPAWQRVFGDHAAALTVEFNAILKTTFFAWALYFNAPVWAGILLALPALLFLCLVAEIMRAHATTTYQAWKKGNDPGQDKPS